MLKDSTEAYFTPLLNPDNPELKADSKRKSRPVSFSRLEDIPLDEDHEKYLNHDLNEVLSFSDKDHKERMAFLSYIAALLIILVADLFYNEPLYDLTLEVIPKW